MCSGIVGSGEDMKLQFSDRQLQIYDNRDMIFRIFFCHKISTNGEFPASYFVFLTEFFNKRKFSIMVGAATPCFPTTVTALPIV